MAIEIEDIKLLVGFYYLATPYTKYTSGLDDAAWDASKVASRVMKRGVAVFCPVKLSGERWGAPGSGVG